MSAMEIRQIAAIMGMCVAGGGYLPVMCDHVLMTDGSGLFLAGPALVQAAIGLETADPLGGAAMHSAISGTVDFRQPNDEACIGRIRWLRLKTGGAERLWRSGWAAKNPWTRRCRQEEIYGAYDASPARPYDMKRKHARVVDQEPLDEYKPEYGKTLICGYARIEGFAVGSRRPETARAADDHEGHKRVEFGGVVFQSPLKRLRAYYGLQPEPDSAGFFP